MKSKYKTYQKLNVDAVPAKGVQICASPDRPEGRRPAAKSGDVVEVESSLEVPPPARPSRTLWSGWTSLSARTRMPSAR